MILDTTSKVLNVVLAEAKVTNDCEVNACWADTASGSTFVPAASDTLTNGTAAVTAVPAPAAATQRAVKELSVYNADTVQHFVTAQLFDGTNTRRIVGWEVPAGDTLYYSAESGWAILPSSSGVVLGANPTATAGPAAVNGTALTFMRSDAAPAVQTATVSQLGLVKPDGTTITISGTGTISSVGGATGANPTATAADTAVNGSAPTFMRSDAAPAVQKGTSGAFGIVKVDGTTITSAGGVISSAGGSTGANPTATAGAAAINGTATTFMRSDGAPAIAKASSTVFGIVEVDNFSIQAVSGVIGTLFEGFLANAAASKALTGSTYTKVIFDTFVTNSLGAQYSISTGLFTPTKAGKYLIFCNILGAVSAGTPTQLNSAISKNGSYTVGAGVLQGLSTQGPLGATAFTTTAPALAIVTMNGSTDTIEIDCDLLPGTGVSPVAYGSGTSTFGAIFLGA